MKKITIALVGVLFVLVASAPASARNDKYLLPISVALQSKDALETPDGSVKFFFGKQEIPEIATKLGTGSTHQRSSTRPSEDAKSCNVAFIKALVALQKNAKQLGANAVVNIASYYKNDTLSSATEFECHAGVSAHVMLRGEFVKVPDH
jgi:hypothetical protein